MKARPIRALLVVGAYLVAVIVLAVPAASFLIDRNVPLPFAIPLGFALANVAFIAVLILIQIVAAVRFRRSKP